MAKKKKMKAKAKAPVKKKTRAPQKARKPAAKKARKTAKPARKAPAKKPAPKLVARPLKKADIVKTPLLAAALKVLDDRQAEDIVTISLAGKSPMADYIIVASGRAARQITAIADYLREAFMKLGIRQVRIEGQQQGDWVLVDGGDVVVHLFRPEVRRYYNIESIWSDPRRDADNSALLIE